MSTPHLPDGLTTSRTLGNILFFSPPIILFISGFFIFNKFFPLNDFSSLFKYFILPVLILVITAFATFLSLFIHVGIYGM
jgi:hypothetical protein